MKNIEDLRKIVGNVTISFAVSPELKYLLQLGAEKEGVTFSEYCRRIMEGNTAEPKKDNPKPEKLKEGLKHEFAGKHSFQEYMKKEGYKRSLSDWTIKKGKSATLAVTKGHKEVEYKITRPAHRVWVVEDPA